MLLENGFSDMGPKIRFLCYQKRPFLIRHFLIEFSNRMWLSENVIRKGFQFLPDDCVAAVKVCVAAGRGGSISTTQAENKNTNQLALVLG